MAAPEKLQTRQKVARGCACLMQRWSGARPKFFVFWWARSRLWTVLGLPRVWMHGRLALWVRYDVHHQRDRMHWDSQRPGHIGLLVHYLACSPGLLPCYRVWSRDHWGFCYCSMRSGLSFESNEKYSKILIWLLSACYSSLCYNLKLFNLKYYCRYFLQKYNTIA